MAGEDGVREGSLTRTELASCNEQHIELVARSGTVLQEW
jgi:hypothetical protein